MQPRPVLGCIASSFAMGIQVSAALARNGMRTVQLVGAGSYGDVPADADALVTAPGAGGSVAALAWLQGAGCRQFYFGHPPAFGEADAVGPVADALVAALGCGFAIACPADPDSGHTVYQGHLFAGRALAGREVDAANLVRVLSRQSEGSVGLIPFMDVERGGTAIRGVLAALKEQGRRYAVADALHEGHLRAIGEAVVGQALVVGAPGLAGALPHALRRAGVLADGLPRPLPAVPGAAAVLVGSEARTSLFQLGTARMALPTLELNALAAPDAEALAAQALGWAEGRLGARPVVIAVGTGAALGIGRDRAETATLVQGTLAAVAQGLAAGGVHRMLLAGGDAAAPVVAALGATRLRFGHEAAPLVPWALAEGGAAPLLLAFKGDDAGGRDLFLSAFEAAPPS